MAENRGSEVAGVAIFFGILSTIFVAMRVYCRATIVKSFGLDDYLAVLAQVSLPITYRLLFKGTDEDLPNYRFSTSTSARLP
jgi:hypothetical protein